MVIQITFNLNLFYYIFIDTRFSNDNSEITLSEHIFDSKIWKKDKSVHKKDDSYSSKNKSDIKKKEKNYDFFNKNKININNKNNLIMNENINNENNIFNYIYTNNNLSNSMSSLNKSSLNKKLSFSLQSKPLGLINKKIKENINSKDINNTSNNNNYIIHNLSKLSHNKKSNNLLAKITEKVTKENLGTKIKQIKEKDEKLEKNISVSSSKSSKSANSNEEPNLTNKIEENGDKKDSNDDEDDILSEQKDEMNEGDNNLLNINKVESINIHSNFIPGHYYTGSGFSRNSNTSNSNKSSLNKKCNTEPNNPQTFIYDCSSGRSNNSGNLMMAGRYGYGGGGYENNFRGRIYNPHSNFGYYFKNSFLSTNTNSQKYDSSYSSESGQSPLFLGNLQSLHYNNTISNLQTNNNYTFQFGNNMTPIGNRHIYTSSFNSNESIFSRQLFSINSNHHNKTDYKFASNFGSKKENQIINLEDVALGKDTRTTVMIRNLPIKYDTNILEKELEPFEGKYDCLYMPYDYDNEGNRGYAFLNLTNPYHLLLFYEFFNNKCWLYFESKKICTLNYANFQGIDEIKKHAKNYKGTKKPIFFICTKDEHTNDIIEIPMKYINLLKKANPNMKYHEVRKNNTFIVDSFN